jgi:hypothetical protein
MSLMASEELEITRGEKALAAVLAVFVLVGLAWAYVELERRPAAVDPTPAQNAAIVAHEQASAVASAAHANAARARENLELVRERYRTALDAGRPAPALERDYRGAEREHAAARRELDAATQAQNATANAAAAARNELAAENLERERAAARLTFALRLLLVLAAIGLAQLAVVRLRGSRLHPLAIATVAAAALLALGMGGDYVTDYVDWAAGGPLVLSLAGIAITLVAFVTLQRFLARRIPLRRVRKSCCAACGYPVRGTPHCEGCGRAVATPCTACEAPRRIGAPRCGTCGAA